MKREDWRKRLKYLLNERGISQVELARRSGLSASAISDWIGVKKSGSSSREPKVVSFVDIANALGVSVDYLLGANECKSPDDEEIHKITGLSDKALEELKVLQQGAIAKDGHATRKLDICNFLLETINETKLFENLYNYLLREFYFNNGKVDLGATVVYARGIDGEEGETLAFAETYGHAFLSQVFQDLAILKKYTDDIRTAKQKADFKVYKESDEGKTEENEILAKQAAYEEREEQP